MYIFAVNNNYRDENVNCNGSGLGSILGITPGDSSWNYYFDTIDYVEPELFGPHTLKVQWV